MRVFKKDFEFYYQKKTISKNKDTLKHNIFFEKNNTYLPRQTFIFPKIKNEYMITRNLAIIVFFSESSDSKQRSTYLYH